MSGGGKGGSSTTSVQIPAWLENAAQQNLARADRVAQIGYTPYFGPDVAAFTPMQEAAMNNTNQAALSFGMAAPTSAMAGIPAAQTFAGGVQGYSSAPLYQQSVEALRTNAPGQYDAMSQMFVDPITGAQPMYPFGTGVDPNAPVAPPVGPQGFDWTQGLSGGVGGSNGFVSTGPNSMSGGAEERRNAAMQAGTFGGGAEERRNAGVQSGTGSFGLPDPMRGGFAGTNLPGRVGGIVNALSGANRPNATPAPKPAAKPAAAKSAPSKAPTSKSKSTSKESGARR